MRQRFGFVMVLGDARGIDILIAKERGSVPATMATKVTFMLPVRIPQEENMSNNIPLWLQYLAVIAPTCSFIVATISVMVLWQGNRTRRINDNAWEVYKQYMSEEIQRARITVRTLMKDRIWETVTDYSSYRTYFQLDVPAGQGDEKKQQELRRQDIDVHNLLAFYHQVGLLLDHKLLPEDFTMQLLGEGLEDRWPLLAPIPHFYSKHAYSGMYKLHMRYRKWKEHAPVESLS